MDLDNNYWRNASEMVNKIDMNQLKVIEMSNFEGNESRMSVFVSQKIIASAPNEI